jgi:acetolactate synthase-1/2/3 large subunit
VLEPLGEADLVVVVGSRLGEVTTQTYGLPRGDQAVVQVDTDPDEVGATVPVERGIVSDARAALEAFTRRAPAKAIERDWTAAHEAYLRFSEVPGGRSEAGVDPAEVVGALRRVLPAGAVLANDAGNFSVFLHRYWRHNHPRTQVAAANGAMGYGVPGAVGAKIASPQSTVVALCGDGGFLMTGQEIETAVRYGVGITVVVFRNGLHGTIAMHQARDVGRTAGSDIGPVDLAGFARSLGAEGFAVADPDDLEPALRDAVAQEGVSLVDVATDPDLISPTARLSELAPEGTP